MRISEILKAKNEEVVVTSPKESVAIAVELMAERAIGSLLVEDEHGALQGSLSERDVVAGLHAQGPEVLEVAVGDLMSRDIVTCRPEDDVIEIMKMMTTERIRHLPVVAGERIQGIISIGDLVKYRFEEAEAEAEALRAYVAVPPEKRRG
jgi:CBS domain-containing protein